MIGDDLPEFVVLPDSERGEALWRSWNPLAPGARTVRYPSGRPWIVGRWDEDEVLTVAVGEGAVALIGLFDVTKRGLTSVVERLRDVGQLDAFLEDWRGSFHAFASVGGRLRAQGTAYGVRRVYHAVVGGVTVVSDRAATLARLTGADVDRASLATRLMMPTPYPLTDRPMWTGVHPVRPGRYLALSHRDGRARLVRWHRPPEPVVPLAAGARGVRAELDAAVALRTRHGGLVSADMSGGFDSTSVAFLAARTLEPGELIVCTGADPTTDDLAWARRGAAHLPGVEHDVFTPEEWGLFYDGVVDERDRFDQPCGIVMTRRRATTAVRRMARRGSRLHLTGIGGDHLFLGQPAHYHALALRRPWLTAQQLRGHRVLFSWPWRELLSAMADRRSFRRAFADIDPRNTAAMEITSVRLAWQYRPRMCDWLTEDCFDLIADALSRAAEDAEPLAPTRGRHAELEAIDITTRDMAAWRDVHREAGVPIALPYFDDHVISAALAVRPEDRVSPFAYKGLLATAMRGVLPEDVLARQTKATGDTACATGLRHHREELAALWDDSALGAAGLVDAGRLRETCAVPDSPELADNGLFATLACETWLRTASPRPRHTSRRQEAGAR
ncbi:asparagine synthase-related protein [Actinokineospora sp. 24-640]